MPHLQSRRTVVGWKIHLIMIPKSSLVSLHSATLLCLAYQTIAIPLRDLGTSNSNSMTSHSALPVIGHNTQQNNGEVPPFDLQRSAVSAVPHEILETAILPPTPINSAFELASTNFHLDGEFPFNEDFTEGGEPLIFDPYMGSSFNCYDIGGWDEM